MDSYAEKYMDLAIQEAHQASRIGEVPVGCVIVKNHQVIATGYNTMEQDQSVLSHAELKAIRSAGIHEKTWRLLDCDLFVTMEPCMMCFGAILHSRLRSVTYGVSNPKTGIFTGPHSISSQGTPINLVQGIREIEIQKDLTEFFQSHRKFSG